MPAKAPKGTMCIYGCGRVVAGSQLRKGVYVPAPERGPGRIRYAGYGWSCMDCYPAHGDPEREAVVWTPVKDVSGR